MVKAIVMGEAQGDGDSGREGMLRFCACVGAKPAQSVGRFAGTMIPQQWRRWRDSREGKDEGLRLWKILRMSKATYRLQVHGCTLHRLTIRRQKVVEMRLVRTRPGVPDRRAVMITRQRSAGLRRVEASIPSVSTF